MSMWDGFSTLERGAKCVGLVSEERARLQKSLAARLVSAEARSIGAVTGRARGGRGRGRGSRGRGGRGRGNVERDTTKPDAALMILPAHETPLPSVAYAITEEPRQVSWTQHLLNLSAGQPSRWRAAESAKQPARSSESGEDDKENWVQCDRCQKWRITPEEITANATFFCEMIPGGSCGVLEDQSWTVEQVFRNEKSPTLERCLQCLEQLAFKVPECGYSHRGQSTGSGGVLANGQRVDAQTLAVQMVQKCNASSAQDVATVLLDLASRIKKHYMQSEWAEIYESAWKKDVKESTSPKDVYEVGKRLEEFGVDWLRLRCMQEFLKTLREFENEDWMSPKTRAFVGNELPRQVMAATPKTSSLSGLCSLLQQLCDALLGHTPQPLSKKRSTKSATIMPWCNDDATAHGCQELRHDDEEEFHYVDGDDERLVLGVDQVWAAGRLANTVEAVSAAVQELRESNRGCSEAGFEKWGKHLRQLHQALDDRRFGVAEPPVSCAADACGSSLHAPEDEDNLDMGDIEERDDEDLGTSAGQLASVLPAKRKAPEALAPVALASPFPAPSHDRGSQTLAARRARSTSPQISEQQMLEYERTYGPQEGAVLQALGSIIEWLELVMRGEAPRGVGYDDENPKIKAFHDRLIELENKAEAKGGEGGNSQGQSVAQRLGAALSSAVSNLRREMGSGCARDAVAARAGKLCRIIVDVDEADVAYATVLGNFDDDGNQMDRLCNLRDACAQQLRKNVTDLRKFVACQQVSASVLFASSRGEASRLEQGHAARAPPATAQRQPRRELAAIARRKSSSAAPQAAQHAELDAHGGEGVSQNISSKFSWGARGPTDAWSMVTLQTLEGPRRGPAASPLGGAGAIQGASLQHVAAAPGESHSLCTADGGGWGGMGEEEEEEEGGTASGLAESSPDPYACLYSEHSDDDVEL